jgi:hypothetical protein
MCVLGYEQTDSINSGHLLFFFSWPVTLTIYNLSPRMCIRLEFMFLSPIIPDLKSPG